MVGFNRRFDPSFAKSMIESRLETSVGWNN
jgi:hypothetical protein